MPLYQLDAIRNAVVDRTLEPMLEEVRDEIATSSWDGVAGDSDTSEVLDAFDAARPRLNVLAAMVRKLAGSRGADISTGLGFLPVVLRQLKVDVIATEADLSMCRFAHDRDIEVRLYRIGFDLPPIQSNSLDFLVFAETLEHIKRSPVPLLRELASLLKPGGHLLLSTPNVARLAHLTALAAGENFLEPFPEYLPLDQDATDHVEHVREYSVREVVDAVEGAGLEIEQVLMTGWGQGGYNLETNPFINDICVVHAIR